MAKGKGSVPVRDKGSNKTAMVSQELRDWISAQAKKGETVDATLRRLLEVPENAPGSPPRDPEILKISEDPTSIRLREDLKAWVERKSFYNESFEHVLRRLLGVGKKEGRNGRR